jgi:four helix bundle protein
MLRESNAEFNEKFRKRTFQFALSILKYLQHKKKILPYVVQDQLSKSATSIGANFRAFCRGRSAKERYAKICITVEEACETMYWIELIKEGEFDISSELEFFAKESDEITRVVSSIKKSYER